MGRREWAILLCLVFLATSDVVKVNDLQHWSDLTRVKYFWAVMGAGAGAVIGYLLKSHADETGHKIDPNAAEPSVVEEQAVVEQSAKGESGDANSGEAEGP